MTAPTLHAVAEILARMERIELEELAFEYVKGHSIVCRVCTVSGQDWERDHVDEDTMLERVRSMSTPALTQMLAPAAWVGVTVHELRSG